MRSRRCDTRPLPIGAHGGSQYIGYRSSGRLLPRLAPQSQIGAVEIPYAHLGGMENLKPANEMTATLSERNVVIPDKCCPPVHDDNFKFRDGGFTSTDE